MNTISPRFINTNGRIRAGLTNETIHLNNRIRSAMHMLNARAYCSIVNAPTWSRERELYRDLFPTLIVNQEGDDYPFRSLRKPIHRPNVLRF